LRAVSPKTPAVYAEGRGGRTRYPKTPDAPSSCTWTERVLPSTTSHAVYSVFLVFASRTELFLVDEIRYVQLSSVCVPRILGGFEIVEYVQYLITCGGQRVLQQSHITQVTYFFVLLTVVTEPLVTLVIVVCHDPSARRTAPLSFIY